MQNKIFGEQWNIFFSFAQRRNVNFERAYPVKQILAEGIAVLQVFGVFVGG